MTRAVVTGGAGFIGLNFLATMVAKYPDIEFICIDKFGYALRPVSVSCIKLDLGDVTNIGKLKEIIGSASIVFHFAAELCVDRSFAEPLLFTQSNIVGTHCILEAIRGTECRLLHISTDEVYGDCETIATERATLAPTNPYAATKAAAEMLVMSYKTSFNQDALIVRSNNVYGPGQHPEKLIPGTISRLKLGKSVIIHGDGHHRRNYLHISDYVAAIDYLWHSEWKAPVYNVGGNDEFTNLEVVKTIADTLGVEPRVEFGPDRRYNDECYHIDSSHLRQLGWTPKVSFSEGIINLIKPPIAAPCPQTTAT